MEMHETLAEQFEQNRGHLRAVAYRMLGSLAEAEDAVQEAWLRLNRTGDAGIDNLGGWLTTVVARVCLDTLRSRKSRREDSLDEQTSEPASHKEANPEQEAVLANSVGLALLVILDTLQPAERLAFVLHDMFDLSFDEIAPIVSRTPAAARQLASRARRRVQGKPVAPTQNFSRQRQMVDAFLAAARAGDFNALVNLLDPNAVLISDPQALPSGGPLELRGAEAIAKRATLGGARAAQPILVNGEVGVLVAPRGHLLMVIRFTITDDKITSLEAIASPDRLEQIDLAVLNR